MDSKTREWLEAFEKRLDAKFEAFERRIDAKFEYTESWLRGRLEETDAKMTGFRTEMVNQFGFVRRDINRLEERVSRLERDHPMAAE